MEFRIYGYSELVMMCLECPKHTAQICTVVYDQQVYQGDGSGGTACGAPNTNFMMECALSCRQGYYGNGAKLGCGNDGEVVSPC